MPAFEFYQQVRVARPRAESAEFAGRVGVILGIGDEPGQPPSYGVFLDVDQQVVCFEAEELEATGVCFRREDFYDDSRRVRVRVDEQGRGRIVE